MKAIYLEGVKSFFKTQKIELADVTIFAGANSSGKSTALQPLLLFKQTLESQYDPGVLLLDGPNVKFTSLDQILSKRAGATARATFTVGFEVDSGASLSATYGRKVGGGMEIKSATITSAEGVAVSFKGGKKFSAEEGALLMDWMPPGGTAKSLLNSTANSNRLSAHWEVIPSRCFPDLAVVGEFTFEDRSVRSIQMERTPIQGEIKKTVSDLIHIQGLRGNPERTYSANARVIPTFQGLFTDYVASVLQQWQDERSPKLDEIGQDLRTLGLSWKVKANRVHDTQVEIKVGRLLSSAQGGAHDLVNLADVGIGVSQVLPCLVALRAAKRGQIVFVEQPEIHLHPRAQYALVEVIVAAVKRGVKVWIETHSSVLLRGFQTTVAKDELDATRVSLNWFSRDPLTGGTIVSAARPNSDGQYGDWPADFDDTYVGVDREYLDAVAQKELWNLEGKKA